MKLRRSILIIASSIIGALLLIQLVGSVVVDLGGIEISSNISLAGRGSTVLSIPPLGMLRAATHKVPVVLKFTLQNVNMDFLKSIIDNSTNKEDLLILLKNDIYRSLWHLSIKTVFVSILGALLAGGIVRLKKQEMLKSLVIGLVVPVLILSSLFFTYDLHAFDTPEYSGALEAAPWVIGLFNNGLDQLGQLGQHLKLISGNISQVFSKMDDVKSLDGEQTARVLHVSDIHNNPAAMDFIEHVVKSFNVDFVVDTGDITDYGTPFEDSLINRISELQVPYVFVAGNHDSLTTVEKLKELKNVTVLDGSATVLEGINILGFSDPSSKTDYIKTPDKAELRELGTLIQAQLAKVDPDILMVHNPGISEGFAGKVPVVLNGHMHALSFSQKNGTKIINAGTTGAAGIRGFQSKNDVPYSAVLLYFDCGEETVRRSLIALDIIKISNLKAGFEIQRAFFDREAIP